MPKVERTSPGSENRYRVRYERSTKWTNDRPGDGVGENSDEVSNLMDDLSVKRGIKRLEKAMNDYIGGKGSKGIQEAIERLEQHSGSDNAKTVVRRLHKIEKEELKEKDSDLQEKIVEGLNIAKKHLNRDRKAALEDSMQRLTSNRRIARKQVLDISKIKKFRSDFLTLMKNSKRVDSYDKAQRWKDIVNKWNKSFDDYIYRYLVEDIKNLSFRDKTMESFSNYWEKKVREDVWPFTIEFRVLISESDKYYTEESRFKEFERELPKWDRRIRRHARLAWGTLKEFVEEYERNFDGKSLEVDVPIPETANIEGFTVIFSGHDAGYSAERFPDFLSRLKVALKRYKSRASAVLPFMLKHQLPINIDFKCRLDLGGEYQYNQIVVCASDKNIGRITHVVAHEMGHHLWRIIGGNAQNFWSRMIKGDLGKLDLRDVIKKYGDKDWVFDNKQMMKSDPFLYNQLMGLQYSQWGDLKSADTLADIKEYLDNGGDPVISLTSQPISGYSNKNPEEAFCEAVGLLVAFGPRAVHAKVRSWLREILPSLKVASKREPISELMKIASELLADSPEYDLKKMYRYWNNKAFGGELPTIPISWIRSKTVGGRVRATVKIINRTLNRINGAGVEVTLKDMALSNFLQSSEEHLNEIMLHEMVHVYVLGILGLHERKGGHGLEFLRKRREISAKTGISIPLKEDMSNMQISEDTPSKEVGVLIMREKGNIGIQVLNGKSLRRNLGAIISKMRERADFNRKVSDKRGDDFWFAAVMSDERELLKYPEQRKYNRGWYKIPQQLINQIMSGGSILQEVTA